jgi:hypothetical protein
VKKAGFKSEAEMCARFIGAIGEDWIAYPETAGWDILLVRKADGFQIGIEAKLRMNVDVINQAIDEYGSWSADTPGPDCRAVLVPTAACFGRIATYIGLTIIVVESNNYGPAFRPSLPKPNHERWGSGDDWHEWMPAKRHALPEYVPDVAAGASAPVQLTPWKISALKLEVLLEKNGFVTKADFRHLGIDHRRWTAPGTGWLKPSASGYVAGEKYAGFKAQHPRVYAEIVADFDKWKPTMAGAML